MKTKLVKIQNYDVIYQVSGVKEPVAALQKYEQACIGI